MVSTPTVGLSTQAGQGQLKLPSPDMCMVGITTGSTSCDLLGSFGAYPKLSTNAEISYS